MREQFRRSPIRRPASTATTMPSDKPRKNAIPAKPFTPTLSATSRTQKSPLTPRLAGSGTPKSYHTPHGSSKASTPLSSKEDISTPVSTLLSTNITPRSGSRNSRREGTATPPSDASPSISFPLRPPSNLGPVSDHSPLSGNHRVEPPRALRKKTGLDDTHTSDAHSQPGSSAGSSVGSPMFFHAADARTSTSSHEQEPKPKPHVKPSSTPVFMYANGAAEEEFRSEGSDHAMHSNKKLAPTPRPQVATTPARQSASQIPQIQSPPSMDLRLPNNNNNNAHTRTRSQTEQSQNPPVLRPPQQGHRPSISSKRPSHIKSPSLDSPEHLHSRRPTLMSSPNITPPTILDEAPQTLPPASPGPNSSVSENTPLSPPPVNTDQPLPLAQSPKKPDGSHSPQASELAANARRERKVLDLEISNSSLLAINRTLEREMRKQNAELRRYRRLSRSGRLSIAGSMRSVSGGQLSIVSEMEDDFSEQSSLNSPEQLSETSDNDSSFADDDNLSPGAVAEHDARHRVRDEKKFYLDLAKHQELLIDSQKMNQSIKRCLSWTEDLLRDGKRALAYKVQVSDIDVGGRVLSSDDTEGGKGLLSSSADLLDIHESPGPAEESHMDHANL